MQDMNTMWKLKWYENLFSVISNLTCPYAIIKGDMLSFWAYGRVGCREYNDIDILVSRNNINMVKEKLEQHGFANNNREQEMTREDIKRARVMYANSHQIRPYYKEIIDCERPVKLDINFDIFWGEYRGRRIPIDKILKDTVDVDIYGMIFKSLAIEMAFIQVCLHQYKDMHAMYKMKYKNPFQTKRFEEIYLFFKNCIQSNTERFINIVYEYEIQDLIFFVLYYTEKVFKDNQLKKCVDELESPKGIANLEYYGLKKEEMKKWKIPFEQRLDSVNLFQIIEQELSDMDRQKIQIVYRL